MEIVIVTNNTILASDVSQSIDALTGVVAYDIKISGSLQNTGSVDIQGLVTATAGITHQLTASNAVSSSYATTASFASSIPSGVGSKWSGTNPITRNSNVEITGSLTVSSSIVDMTGTTVISGSLFSGSFIGDGSGLSWVTSPITIKDEGSNLTTAVSSINFVGSGVTAATDGDDVTATIVGADLTNVFDEDGNGDIQPSDTSEGISVFYEYDDNNDIIPRT